MVWYGGKIKLKSERFLSEGQNYLGLYEHAHPPSGHVRLYGLEGVRVQNIAELAGLTLGALYRYFDSKGTLMRELHRDRPAGSGSIDHLVGNTLRSGDAHRRSRPCGPLFSPLDFPSRRNSILSSISRQRLVSPQYAKTLNILLFWSVIFEKPSRD